MVAYGLSMSSKIEAAKGVRRPYGATITEAEGQQPRRAQIVMSSLPVEKLPVSSTDPGCKHVVTVEYKLTGNDMKLKNRQMWKIGKKYWQADFFFVVMLGPADLRFQIEGKQGILSSRHDSLKVEFADAVTSSAR
ncbi:hypothetical protein LTR78_010225 [Recurvomyces mirabilis]|uniref:Uncharacterized protein n=1 Tax=Recurvomyces mirabilis TaxID=574656 RepID=A0AAE0TMP0_9PEZI|nr:hypothetical protein LTR78_010225 [Recurvomyces mirabilis]KAK5149691.1 hypothetical protein LTS14_010752 [Recurvomyces mirabilis]